MCPTPRNAPPSPSQGICAGGMWFYWECGAIQALSEAGVRFDRQRLRGASAGALAAVLAACDVDLDVAVARAYGLAVEADAFNKPSGLAWIWGDLVSRWLEELLPEDAAERCRGRVSMLVLKTWPLPPERKEVVDYVDKGDLIRACRASIHIPFFLSPSPVVHYRGEWCVDGSLFAQTDIVRNMNRQGEWCYLVNPYDDPFVQARQRDFLRLTTLDGLQGMVQRGKEWTSHRIACGDWLDSSQECALKAVLERPTDTDKSHTFSKPE